MAEADQWDWLTTDVFLKFAEAKSINLNCTKCPSEFPQVFVDTVTSEGFIPRSSTFGADPDTGNINFGRSRHLPCARVICKSCGHVDLYSMYAVKSWKTGAGYGE